MSAPVRDRHGLTDERLRRLYRLHVELAPPPPPRIAVRPHPDGFEAFVTDPGDGRRAAAGSRAIGPTRVLALKQLGQAMTPSLWVDLCSSIDPDCCAS